MRENVYDIVRRKYVVLTPEEYVRQMVIDYLVNNLSYPRSSFRVERQLQVNDYSRPDIVVYDSNCEPYMVVECKSAGIKMSYDTIYQLVRYNRVLKANYVMITNGTTTHCWKLENDRYVISMIPKFDNS